MTVDEFAEALLPLQQQIENLSSIVSGVLLFLGFIFGLLFIKMFLERF